ncbi:MAG TPA: universal stress protein [Micropepsaceae bacterium]|nr:universal stress protein [Micropepsaceae bacterium]
MPIRSIVHPTDLSEACIPAFVHALRISLLAKCNLDVVHIVTEKDVEEDMVPPQVRHTLALWGLAKESDPPASIGERLNIKVAKLKFSASDPVSGVLDYLHQHPCDLLVFATHGREGWIRWARGSVAETVAVRALTPSLFFPPGAKSFIDEATGEILLRKILLPIDHEPGMAAALPTIFDFLELFGKPELRLVHFGTKVPAVPRVFYLPTLELRPTPAIEGIVKEADEWNADLILMPTAGHSGLKDAISGSTSERVIRHAPCPVLTIPVHN